MIYLDCIVLKIRLIKWEINRSMYAVLGINVKGQREPLGLRLVEKEGARFWLSELIKLGLVDIHIV